MPEKYSQNNWLNLSESDTQINTYSVDLNNVSLEGFPYALYNHFNYFTRKNLLN